MSHVVLGAQRSAHGLPMSRSERPRRRLECWPALGAVLLSSACTLTSDSFEPGSVERVETVLSPVDPGPQAPPGVGTGGGGVATDPSAEQLNEPARLDSTDVDDAPSDGASAATDGEDPPAGDVDEPDAGGEPSAPATAEDGPAPVAPGDACPGQTFGVSCYQVFGELAAWDTAEQRCIAWGGQLATVQSPEENTFLDGWPATLGITAADGSGVWLGATDAALEGDFRWLDGSGVSDVAWAPNQPDNGAGQDCIEKRNDGTGLWYDLRCTDLQGYVCERPL